MTTIIKMKRAIVTITTGLIMKEMALSTHPFMRAYANKVGADFIVWDTFRPHLTAHWKKLELRGLLKQYDRVLLVDTDIVIRSCAPDIFDIVPEDKLGILDETGIWGEKQVVERYFTVYNALAKSLGFDGLKIKDFKGGRYLNTGVLVLSKGIDFFDPPAVEVQNFGEQTWLNAKILELDTPLFLLPAVFNYCISGGANPRDGFFVHYAGVLNRLVVLKKDCEEIYSNE